VESTEFDAGAGQVIVLYVSKDDGMAIDIADLYAQIAADAKTRASAGQRIVGIGPLPLRHAGQFMAKQGSGYETLVSIAVVYSSAG
jgi:hypothetical protein